jgi:hypothetical protein
MLVVRRGVTCVLVRRGGVVGLRHGARDVATMRLAVPLVAGMRQLADPLLPDRRRILLARLAVTVMSVMIHRMLLAATCLPAGTEPYSSLAMGEASSVHDRETTLGRAFRSTDGRQREP